MANLLDYVQWRGDLSYTQDAFNEVDNLIFSQLIYLPFEGIDACKEGGSGVRLDQLESELVAHRVSREGKNRDKYEIQMNKLMLLCANSVRFRNVRIRNYVNILDSQRAEQFCAAVFSLSDRLHYIAFRGTGDLLVGWKEDFMMSFRSEVPAQRQAVEYVNNALRLLKGNCYFGGHSKGGNLAVYAAIHLKRSARKRVLGVYSNDGPGFQPEVISLDGYLSMKEKIHTYMPQSSVVGILLEHSEEYTVVSSTNTGAKQHKALSWEVKGNRFVYEKELTKNSRTLDIALRSWLGQIPDGEKEQFVNAIFELLDKTGARTCSELSESRLKKAERMIRAYKTMDSETQGLLKNVLQTFFREKKKIQKELAGHVSMQLAEELRTAEA